jgi:hypothetical protein
MVHQNVCIQVTRTDLQQVHEQCNRHNPKEDGEYVAAGCLTMDFHLISNPSLCATYTARSWEIHVPKSNPCAPWAHMSALFFAIFFGTCALRSPHARRNTELRTLLTASTQSVHIGIAFHSPPLVCWRKALQSASLTLPHMTRRVQRARAVFGSCGQSPSKPHLTNVQSRSSGAFWCTPILMAET